MRVRASGGCCEDGLVLSSRPFTPKGSGKNPLDSSLHALHGSGIGMRWPYSGKGQFTPFTPEGPLQVLPHNCKQRRAFLLPPLPTSLSPLETSSDLPARSSGLTFCLCPQSMKQGRELSGWRGSVCVPVTSRSQEHWPLLPCVLSTVWGC